MPLHPEIAKFIASLPAPPEEPQGPPDPAVLRADEEAHRPPVREELHRVEDTAADGVPVRIYTPDEDGSKNGTLVYFHGGAFFLGSLDTHDHITRSLAKETGLEVVSVGYRRAPEASYPAGLQDCYRVVRWAAERTSGEVLAIAGDSSGGNFAAAVAAMARDDGFAGITHQVLYYPSLDLDFDEDRYPSLRENAKGYGLETAGLKPFNSFYLGSGADPADPLVSPVKREDLNGLPKALIVTAQYDPLRDEGELYGEKLKAAGVDATVTRYEGAGHGFVQHFSWIPEFGRVYAETARFLNR